MSIYWNSLEFLESLLEYKQQGAKEIKSPSQRRQETGETWGVGDVEKEVK